MVVVPCLECRTNCCGRGKKEKLAYVGDRQTEEGREQTCCAFPNGNNKNIPEMIYVYNFVVLFLHSRYAKQREEE